MKVIAIVADIVRSREIDRRPAFQVRLKKLLAEVSESSSTLLSPYTITLGDEFQAVYGRTDRLFTDIAEIVSGLYDARVRFAVAYGALSTPINRTAALEMDGPAFHVARRMMQELKDERRTVIRLSDEDESDFGGELALANACLSLLANEMERWRTNTTASILSYLMKGWSVAEIAGALNIGRRAVNKNIDNNHLRSLVRMFSILTTKLRSLWAGGEEEAHE